MAVKTASRKRKRAAPRPQAAAARKPVRSLTPAAATRSFSRQIAWVSLGLAVLTVALYSRVGKFQFLYYDDQDYVFENAHVKQGLTWDTFRWSLTSTEQTNWHPLTWISHAFDWQIYGGNAGGHHWTNVTIHAINVVLLFLLLQRVTGALWRSTTVAALFAAHPLNVESVAWVAERKNVLSTLFFFLAIGAYGWYVRKPELRRYVVVAVLFVLGLASKPMVITLPFVLLLLDYWPFQRVEGWSEHSETFPVPQRSAEDLIKEKIPLFVLSAGSAVITLIAQAVGVVPTDALPLSVRLESAVYAYGVYLFKMVWPASLALIYPHPGRTLPWWQAAAAGLVLVLMTVLAWRRRHSSPYLAVGWLWFLGAAVPIIGIVQVGMQVVADRYAYIPLIGVFVMAVWGANEIAASWQLPLYARALGAGISVAALAAVTWSQLSHWDNTLDVWTHGVAVTEKNSVAEHMLANELIRLNRYPEAMIHMRKYAHLEPLDVVADLQVAAYLQDQGQLQDSLQEYRAALRAQQGLRKIGFTGLNANDLAVTYANVGIVDLELGDTEGERENVGRSLAADSGAIDRLTNQILALVQSQPSAAAYARLGLLFYERERVDEAQRAFARARNLDPNIPLPSVAVVTAAH
ncbi:MAG TPA: hypothetical protein VND65_21310 [Candidatus Binatia bacterium]|nr:hypothetical protein [Candidatus Binatia bacterium]